MAVLHQKNNANIVLNLFKAASKLQAAEGPTCPGHLPCEGLLVLREPPRAVLSLHSLAV